MRCRTEDQVPKCFRKVKCPYPTAETAAGTYGSINYSLGGPVDGELVVCIHGLNGSRLLFSDLDRGLRDRGFRVLCFDLYAHGLSNAPRVDLFPCTAFRKWTKNLTWAGTPRARYDLDFFVEQTSELLELLGLGSDELNLIGFSLGGAVAVAFAARYPRRVLRLVAMSPAGFLPRVPASYYLLKATWCWLIPLASLLLCTCWYKRERFGRSFRGRRGVSEEAVESLWSRFVWQLYVKRGVPSATLAICHRIPWFGLRPLFEEVGRSQRPVLLLWGQKDTLNPPDAVAQKVQACFSNSHLIVVKDAGHIALCDKPRQVIGSILAFLQLPPDARMAILGPGLEASAALLAPQLLRPATSAGPGPRGPRGPSTAGHGAMAPAAGDDGPAGDEAPGEPSGEPSCEEWASQMPVPMVLGHTADAGSAAAAVGCDRRMQV